MILGKMRYLLLFLKFILLKKNPIYKYVLPIIPVKISNIIWTAVSNRNIRNSLKQEMQNCTKYIKWICFLYFISVFCVPVYYF